MTVATRSHLDWALTLVESIRATRRSQVRTYVALVDGPGDDHWAPFAAAGVLPFDAAGVGAPDRAWLATKFSAMELSCAVKPFVVRALLDAGHDSVLYADEVITDRATDTPTSCTAGL